MLERCGTCAHWRRPDQRDSYSSAVSFQNDEWDDDADDGFGGYVKQAEQDRLFGECEGVPQGWDLADVPIAAVRDGSDYKATLFTKAEFGCVLWTDAAHLTTADQADGEVSGE